jgi:hypothetical protein
MHEALAEKMLNGFGQRKHRIPKLEKSLLSRNCDVLCRRTDCAGPRQCRLERLRQQHIQDGKSIFAKAKCSIFTLAMCFS